MVIDTQYILVQYIDISLNVTYEFSCVTLQHVERLILYLNKVTG